MKRFIQIAIFLLSSITASAAGPDDASRLFQSAKTADDANDFTRALELYLKADSAYMAEQKSHSPEFAQSLHNTGRAYLNTNQVQKGRAYTLRAAQLRAVLFGKNSKEYVSSLNNYALSFLKTGELADALKYQTEVVALCGQMDPPAADEGMYLINLGRIYHAMGDTGNCTRYLEEALSKVEKFSPNYEYTLSFLGNLYMQANDNANTNRILGLMEEHNQHELSKECNTLECHLERAEYYQVTGNPALAKEEFMAAFALPLTDSQKSTVYEQYAQFLSHENDYAQAGTYYSRAAEIRKKVTGPSEKITKLNRQAGLCYAIGKQYDQAIVSLLSVIADVDKFAYPAELKISALQGLGNAYSAKKDYRQAVETFQQLIRYHEQIGHTTDASYAKAYERLASAQKFNADYEASIANYETAIDLYGKSGMYDEQENARAGLKLCLYYAGKGTGESGEDLRAQQQRDRKMRDIITSSLNMLEQGGDFLGKLANAKTMATIAGSYAQLKEYDKALDYYTQYIQAIRPALAEIFLLKNSKERRLIWQTELNNITEMNALIMELPEKRGDLYDRLSTLIYEGQLLSKGILLSSDIEFDKILNRYGTKEMKSEYATIQSNLSQISSMRMERRPIEEILSLERTTDALQLALARESAQFADFTDYLRISRSDVLRALGDDEAAVEFVTLRSGIIPNQDMVIAIVVSNEYPTGKTVPIGSVRQIKRMIDDKHKFANNGYTKAIWGNIMQLLPEKRTIYFAPDGVMNNIGIEYLTIDGIPVSRNIDMVRLSSTKEIARKHTAIPIRVAALFGDIDYIGGGKSHSNPTESQRDKQRASDGTTFDILIHARREVSEIYKLLRKHAKTTISYTGAKANKEAFLAQQKKPLNLLHIATHGKYIDGGEHGKGNAMERSILALAGANLYEGYKANQGIVSAAEIADMSLLECDLVVLSACESGLGQLGDDGVFGLQRGFKNAGVRSLLVSLGKVTDASTAEMMIAFYRYYFEGKGISKREALQKAQSEIRVKYPDDDTWASFVLIDSFF